MLKATFKVGRSSLQVEAQDFKSLLKYTTLFGSMPEKCGKCGSDDIFLRHKSPKGNDYYGLECRSCGAEFNFHQRKEGGFYIKHDDEWTKFFEDGGGQTAKPPQDNGPENFESDIPF